MHRHFIIHKPFGFISQFKQEGNHKKRLLGELYNFPEGTMSIGRLDKDSEGLLLLTTDGKVSYEICSNKVEKEYHVLVDGIPDTAALQRLEDGVEISIYGESYLTKPCEASILHPHPTYPPRIKKIRDDRHGPSTWISITIREGKYRQVRKMTAKAGYPTLRLMRYRVGRITLGDLKGGDVLEVDQLQY